jgi:hypothetical protein
MLKIAEQVASFEEVVWLTIMYDGFDILSEVMVWRHDDLLCFFTEIFYSVESVRESKTFKHL